MTAFGKLIRTTAFRLTLVYLFLFALFAASLRTLVLIYAHGVALKLKGVPHHPHPRTETS